MDVATPRAIDPDIMRAAQEAHAFATAPPVQEPTINVAGMEIPITETEPKVVVEPTPREQLEPHTLSLMERLFPPPLRPLGQEEKPFRTLGKKAMRVGAEVVSGITLNVADALVKRATDGRASTFPDLVDKVTGLKPDKTDILAGDIANFMAGIQTAGKVAMPVIRRVAKRQALKVIAGTGLTFATRKAGEEFADKVINNDPVDYEGINFEFGIGTMFGAGQVGIERFARFIKVMRAGKIAKTQQEFSHIAARSEVAKAKAHWKKTGDRSQWDAVIDKYTGRSPVARSTPTQAPPVKDFGQNPLAIRQPGVAAPAVPATARAAAQPAAQPGKVDLSTLSRKELQARAKAAGIPANQKSAAIIQQLSKPETALVPVLSKGDGGVTRIAYRKGGEEIGTARIMGNTIGDIEVKEPYRRQGYGTQMMQDLIDRGGTAMFPVNEASQALARSMGFAETQDGMYRLKGPTDATQITPTTPTPAIAPTGPTQPVPVDTQQPGQTTGTLSVQQAQDLLKKAYKEGKVLTEAEEKQLDEAWHTGAVEIPTSMPDATLMALPGNEAAMQEIAAKMAKVGPLRYNPPRGAPMDPPAYPAHTTKNKTLFKRVDKARGVVTYNEKGERIPRYAIEAARVDGKNLVVTDGRRMFVLKGEWGPSGLYDDKAAFAKQGSLKQKSKDLLPYPKYKDIIPEVRTADGIELDTRKTWQMVRQAKIAAPSDEGAIPTIAIMKNPDNTIGFASADPTGGVAAQVGVKDGAKQVAAVNANFMQDALELHAARGEKKIKLFLGNKPEIPVVTKGPKGQTVTVTMPVQAVSTKLAPPVKTKPGMRPTQPNLAQQLVNAKIKTPGQIATDKDYQQLRNAIPEQKFETPEAIAQMTEGKVPAKAIAKDLVKWSQAGILDERFDKDGNPVYAWQGTEVPPDYLAKEEAEIMMMPDKDTATVGDYLASPAAVDHEIDRGRLKVQLEPDKSVGPPIPPGQIIKYARRAFNVPIRGMATHMPGRALGWYNTQSKGIRLRDVRSITTAMHEIGHALDGKTDKDLSQHPKTKEIADELMAMGQALYGKTKPVGGYKSEGWAEFIREYLTGNQAQEIAPKLYEWFKTEYLPAHPKWDIGLNRLKQMISTWTMPGSDARLEAMINRKPLKGTLGERLERLSLWTETNWIDELAPLRRRMEQVGLRWLPVPDNPYDLAVAYADASGAVARHMVLSETTDLAGNRTGPGLTEIMKPIEDVGAFIRYAVSRRALNWWKRGINPGIARVDANYVIDKYKSDQFETTLKDVTEWNHRVLQYLVDAGGLSKEALARMKALNPVYVPFFRVFEWGELRGPSGTGKGFVPTGKGVFPAKGSGREIKEIFEGMVQQAERIVKVAHKTMVARALAKVADKPGAASIIEKVPPPRQATTFSAEQIKRDLLRLAEDRLGIDPDMIDMEGFKENWDELLTVYTNASNYWGKDNIVPIVIDGKKQWYELDKDVMQVIHGLDKYTLPPFFDFVFGKLTRTLRLGATGLNPAFGITRNFLRDALTFTVTAQHAKGGPVAALGGVVQDIKGTEPARRFKALGGEMAGEIMQDRRAAKDLRAEMLLDRTKKGKYLIKTVAHPVQAMRELFSIPESGVRIAEFEAAYEEGERRYGKNSVGAAIYGLNAAKDVTTNFTRHGKLAKMGNQVTPFFNANIQGPHKIYRTFKDPKTRKWAGLMAISSLTVPSIGLWALYKDEEWYENMDVSERVGYLHFRIPGTDTIVRLPQPFEVGHIFGSLPVAAIDAIYRKDPKRLTEDFWAMADSANPFGKVFPPAGMALVKPAWEIAMNKDWAGRPIIPREKLDDLPEDQYRNHTTKMMKALGDLLNLPPAVMEYAVNSYSGGLYMRLAKGWGLVSGDRTRPRTVSDIPVFGTLFLREPYAPRAQTTRFYEAREDLNRKYNSKKITPKERAKRKQYNDVATQLRGEWQRLEKAKTTKERKRIYGRVRSRLPREFTQ